MRLQFRILFPFAFGVFLCLSPIAQVKTDANKPIGLKKIEEFDAFRNAIFSPDGGSLALGGVRNRFVKRPSIKIVNFLLRQQVCELDVPEATSVLPASFSPDSKLLAISYSVFDPKADVTRGTIALVDSATCERKRTVGEGTVNFSPNVSFSKDGRQLIGHLDSIRIWNVETGVETYSKKLSDGFEPVLSRLSPDGKWLISHARNPQRGKILYRLFATNLENKTVVDLGDDNTGPFTFSDDSELLFVGSEYAAKDGSDRRTRYRIRVFTIGKWELVKTIEDANLGYSFDISTKTGLLATGTNEGKVELYSLENTKEKGSAFYYKRTTSDNLNLVPEMIASVGPIRFSPDGTVLMTAGARGNVILWRIE